MFTRSSSSYRKNVHMKHLQSKEAYTGSINDYICQTGLKVKGLHMNPRRFWTPCRQTNVTIIYAFLLTGLSPWKTDLTSCKLK